MLTDAQGRRTDFRNTVLVMTSNLGARHFRAQGRLGFLPEEGTDRAEVERAVLAEARRTFAPEFLNRLDGTWCSTHWTERQSGRHHPAAAGPDGQTAVRPGGVPPGGGRRPSGCWPRQAIGTTGPGLCGGPSRPRWRILPPTCCCPDECQRGGGLHVLVQEDRVRVGVPDRRKRCMCWYRRTGCGWSLTGGKRCM